MADVDEIFAAEALEDYEPEVENEGEEVAPESTDPYDVLYKFHPETIVDYAETVIPNVPLEAAPPDGEMDAKHMSPPFLTVYERAKILGTRTNQLACGARPFITVPEYVKNPLEIAKLELEQRRLPFIVKRPMPDGTFENWRLSDLMIL
jgi:DNA-directed RNA polymerase I, II, and III subunit RPABC2